jgi:hypothetical protein
VPGATADLQEVRDRLPVAKYWTYTHDSHATDVTAGYGHCWPEVLVILEPRGSGVTMGGTFTATGRLRQLTFEATRDQSEITTAVLRQLPAIRALKESEIVAREAAHAILAGVPDREIVLDATSATEALRMLMAAAGRAPGTRKRGAMREDLLRQVADAYREAVASRNPKPRETLAARFGYSPAHIGRLLMAARKARAGQPPLLGPAKRGRAGETQSPKAGDFLR